MRTPILAMFALVAASAFGQDRYTPEKAKTDWKGDYPLSVPLGKGMAAPEYRTLDVLARDGKKLVVHEWAAPKPKPGQPVVLFLHGIGMHGPPHGSVAAAFTSRNIVLICPDLRGHGRSAGEREVLAEPEILRSDLGEVIGLVNKRHPQSLVFLAGESMGGLLAADYATRGERRLDGLILLVPAFQVHASQISLKGFGTTLFTGAVELAKEEKLKPSTREQGFVNARLKDDKALRQVKNSYLVTLSRIQGQYPKAADKITVPLFLGLAGKDSIVESKAAQAVFDQAGTPKNHKKCCTWDEACHTLCWDPLTPTIMEEVANWVLQRGNGAINKKK